MVSDDDAKPFATNHLAHNPLDTLIVGLVVRLDTQHGDE